MSTRRHFFHVSGYDEISTADLHRRFKREFAIFLRTWKLSGTVADIAPGTASWTVNVAGPNWQNEATYESLPWDDLIRKDGALGMAARLKRSWFAFCNVVGSGALLHYFWAFPRYGFFFLFPFVTVLGFALAGLGLGYGVAWLIDLSGILRWLLAVVLAIPIFIGLFGWLGERWRIAHGLDDWGLSAECSRGLRPDVDQRVETFVARVVAAADRRDIDEIVILGHSLGASLAVETLGRILARHKNFAREAPRVTLITVGATIPKFSLHPYSNWLRESAERIIAEPDIAWAEYHARDDAISFYKFDPIALEHVRGDGGDRKPYIRFAQIYDMVSPEMFRRIAKSRMRLHYQFVMANDRRGRYDYFMFCCGPLPAPQIILSSAGYRDFLTADGALITSRLPDAKRQAS